MLRHIFGPVIDQLTVGADPDQVSAAALLLGSMFSVLNSGVLIVGSLIVSYVAAVGVLNTANDGEAMGRNWSSLWTPVRIVSGGAVLLPTASGYSFIQLIVMMLALWGAGLANAVYNKGVAMGLVSPNGIVAAVHDPGSYHGLRDFARQYVAASYCARAANATFADPNTGTAPQVQANSSPDAVFNQGGRREYVFEIKDRNEASNLAGGAPICGTVKVGEYYPQTRTDATAQAMEQVRSQAMEAKKQTVVQMMAALDQWVNTWPTRVSADSWNTVNSAEFNRIVNESEERVASTLADNATSSETALGTGMNAFVNSLTLDGWASAGGWFQRVGMVRGQLSGIFAEPAGSVSPPTLTGLPNSAAAAEFVSSVSMAAEVTRKAETHKDYSREEVRPEDIASRIPTDPQAAVNIGQMRADMDAKTSSWINNSMKYVVDVAVGGDGSNGTTTLCATAGEIGGSLNRMKCVGDYLTVILAATKTISAAVKTAMAVLRVGAGTLSSVKGVGTGLDLDKVVEPIWDWMLEVPLAGLATMSAYLEPLAFYFGVFLPSLPYTIFMIVVCGWVLAVLQACLAAPLWAIMHMTPDSTFVGSQRQGYLLLPSLFVCPALAVVGLFAGILISDPLIDFTAKAFFSMHGAVSASTGAIGAISEFLTFAWWLIVFGATLLPILYMSFGLPQALPDKVLQWIGGGVHDLGETAALGEMRTGMAHAQSRGSLPVDGRRRGGGGRLPPGCSGGTPPPGGGGVRPSAPPLSTGPQGVGPSPSSPPAPQSLPRLTGGPGGGCGGARLAPIGPQPGVSGPQGVTPRSSLDGQPRPPTGGTPGTRS
ncbi:type IV secretion system protein DotA-like protein [Xanthomonas populi]|uniref:Type IV secretion system protein DotA-like protein n=2 Tax=Xanthomonas populi TaxID=53414 RepID=A0A2S7ENL6_9XANT|nr:DotA/TraY family protein [Xanthomonas populi]PPU93072.1 type IV secretion system protein DotA-like protein [Xanthomonas populi]